MSNVSHLSVVNYLVQSRVYGKISKPTPQRNTRPVDFSGDRTNQQKQITNQKHETYVDLTSLAKLTNSSFSAEPGSGRLRI